MVNQGQKEMALIKKPEDRGEQRLLITNWPTCDPRRGFYCSAAHLALQLKEPSPGEGAPDMQSGHPGSRTLTSLQDHTFSLAK